VCLLIRFDGSRETRLIRTPDCLPIAEQKLLSLSQLAPINWLMLHTNL